MKRLILHIGDHKTGTSALQRRLASGVADDCALYPVAGRAEGKGHHNLAWQCGNDKRFKPKRGGWADIAAEVAATNKPNIIISSEAFEFIDAELALPVILDALAKAVAQIDIIVYLRAHGSRITSSFGERVRRGIGPFCLDTWIEQSLAEHRFHYAPRLARWQQAAANINTDPAAPKTRLIPLIYDKAHLQDGDVVADFLHRFLGHSAKPDIATATNKAPSGQAIHLMCSAFSALAKHTDPVNLRRLGVRVAKAAMKVSTDDQPLSLMPIQQSHLAERLRADAEALDTLFAETANTYFTDALLDHGPRNLIPVAKPDLCQVADCLSLALLAKTGPPQGKQKQQKPTAQAPRKPKSFAA